MERGEKLRLKEVGPYTYREVWEKKDTVWHPNGTLSYRQEKNYTFEPSLSFGAESDIVVVPNVPVLSAAGQMPHSPKIVKKAIGTLLDVLKLEPFSVRNVKEILWGYDDPLIKLAKQFLPEGKRPPFDNFGLLIGKNATLSDVFTVLTGKENLEDFARIALYKGQSGLGVWKTDACNELKGSDGTGFPSMLNENSTVYIYQPDFCRPLELVVKNPQPQKHQGFETLRFQPADHVFGTVEDYPQNDCYCLSKPCALKGTFNVSQCQFGSPIFLSWPHFLHGDPSLREKIDGLNPNPKIHQFYIDLQPKLGLAMQAKARLQINIQMKKVAEIPQTANLSDLLVPIIWIEDGIEELPPVVLGLIRQAINMPEVAEAALSYVLFIMGGLMIVGGFLYFIRNSYIGKESMVQSNVTSKADSYYFKGGEVEKSNGLGNGLVHQYSNTVEMEDAIKHPNGNSKSKEAAMETKEAAANGTTNESIMT
ncbi:Scavenger receptor class B member 1, partial [Orchesella cincta]